MNTPYIPRIKIYKDKNKIELAIDEEKGLMFITDAGYTELSGGVGREEIEKRLASLTEIYPNFKVPVANVFTSTGIKLVFLLPSFVVFRWILVDNFDLAEKIGITGIQTLMLS